MFAGTCGGARRLGGTVLPRIGAADRKSPRRWARWAIARATRPTDRGAFLDIALDFLVYAAVPLGFAAWDPHANAFPAAFLLASFVANGSAFLAFSTMAEKRGLMTARQGRKSISIWPASRRDSRRSPS
jgi:hypothetical protein